MMVTPITSDVPTPKELVARARALIPTLIERAPAQQAHRRILDETMADLKAAGFFKIFQPRFQTNQHLRYISWYFLRMMFSLIHNFANIFYKLENSKKILPPIILSSRVLTEPWEPVSHSRRRFWV